MSEFESLGYVGVPSAVVGDWIDYGTKLLGMQLVDSSARSAAFRMDDRKQRLIVHDQGQEATPVFGWEVADSAALDRLAARLQSAKVKFSKGSAALALQRHVTGLLEFADPYGNRLEAFYGAEIANEPFKPGRAISGFRTGVLGMGHAVLTVERVEDVRPFYEDLLGFRLSDFTAHPFKAYFFHLNARHHSLALVETGKKGIHHLMMELYSLDDVGQAYDLALLDERRIGATLGRHTNDLMTSFYAWTPSEFMVEYGWGGRSIDPATWQPFELKHGPSLWGHDRTWLTPQRRAEARDLRLNAAALGIREPVQVIEGNYELAPGICPWWDATVRSNG